MNALIAMNVTIAIFARTANGAMIANGVMTVLPPGIVSAARDYDMASIRFLMNDFRRPIMHAGFPRCAYRMRKKSARRLCVFAPRIPMLR